MWRSLCRSVSTQRYWDTRFYLCSPHWRFVACRRYFTTPNKRFNLIGYVTKIERHSNEKLYWMVYMLASFNLAVYIRYITDLFVVWLLSFSQLCIGFDCLKTMHYVNPSGKYDMRIHRTCSTAYAHPLKVLCIKSFWHDFKPIQIIYWECAICTDMSHHACTIFLHRVHGHGVLNKLIALFVING